MKHSKLLLSLIAVTALSGTASAQTVSIGSNPQGSLFHRTSVAVAKLMNEKMGIKARVQPYSGSSTYIPLLNNNEVQLAMVNVGDAGNAWEAVDNFANRPQKNLRLLSAMFPLRVTCAVPADHPARTLEDLKGLRTPTEFTSQTTIVRVNNAVLATAGLSLNDMKPYPTPNIFNGFEALGEGKVDFACIAPGVTAVQKAQIKLKSRGGVRFISINTGPAQIAAMKKIIPSRPILVKPAKHLVGVVAPTWFMGYNVVLTTNDKMSDDAAYKKTGLVLAGR